MRDVAFYLPHGDAYLAVVATLPDGRPRGVVQLLQGADADRAMWNQMFTRIARGLAGVGIACVRQDWTGMGDSSGPMHQTLDTPPLDQARAVLAAARSELGIADFGIVGNCIGIRPGLELALEDPACRGVVAIINQRLEPVLRYEEQSPGDRLIVKLRRLRRLPRRLARKVLGARRVGPPRLPISTPFKRVLAGHPTLVLYAGPKEQRERLGVAVTRAAGRAGGAGRVGQGTLPNDQLERRDRILAETVAWMDRWFAPAPDAAPAPHAQGAGAAADRTAR